MFQSPPDQNGFRKRFLVTKESVRDEKGSLVPRITPLSWSFSEGPTCGILIQQKNDEDEDKDSPSLKNNGWICEIELDKGILGQESLRHLSAEIHLQDDLLTHLPPGAKVQHYDLNIRPDFSGNLSVSSFSGEVGVWVHVERNGTASIPLHLDQLKIEKLSGWSRFGSRVRFAEIIFDIQKTTVQLVPQSPLSAGDDLTVYLTFSGNVPRGDHYQYGFYKELCSNKVKDKYCWFTQFAMTNARNTFPCSIKFPPCSMQFPLCSINVS